MSTSIDEAIERAEAEVRLLAKVRERFPNASAALEAAK